ncbi:N-acetylmuramoyl-L-alanine amidase [Bacillus sp. JCM 19041]|uniref:N-acetylmuramoyl-L-alanine amidase n=1 Tax=Bacillus sp. JCM 19041 TaxID=1460637 RepID=UPI0006CFA280
MTSKKLLISFLLSVTIALFSVAGHAFAETIEQGEVDTQSSLNVRSAPGTWSDIVGSKLPGDVVEYIDNENGWGKLTDGSGYVSLDYVTTHEHTPIDDEDTGTAPSGNRIILDPGHGGIDSGAASNGLLEKHVVLDIAKRTQILLEDRGFKVKLTREEDLFLELEERVAIAETWQADQFVSIHANGFSDPNANGIETFYYPGSSNGKSMAAAVQNQLIDQTDRRNRGVFEETFYVLRHTSMPAILIEAGFVTNESDAARLQDDHYLQSVAESIAIGISGE